MVNEWNKLCVPSVPFPVVGVDNSDVFDVSSSYPFLSQVIFSPVSSLRDIFTSSVMVRPFNLLVTLGSSTAVAISIYKGIFDYVFLELGQILQILSQNFEKTPRLVLWKFFMTSARCWCLWLAFGNKKISHWYVGILSEKSDFGDTVRSYFGGSWAIQIKIVGLFGTILNDAHCSYFFKIYLNLCKKVGPPTALKMLSKLIYCFLINL